MRVKHAEGWPIINIINLHQDGNQQCFAKEVSLVFFFFPVTPVTTSRLHGFCIPSIHLVNICCPWGCPCHGTHGTRTHGFSGCQPAKPTKKSHFFCGDSSNLKTFQFGVVNVPQLFLLIFHDFVWCLFSTFCFIFIMATIKINSSGFHNIICFIKTNSFARNSLFSYFSSI